LLAKPQSGDTQGGGAKALEVSLNTLNLY